MGYEIEWTDEVETDGFAMSCKDVNAGGGIP